MAASSAVWTEREKGNLTSCCSSMNNDKSECKTWSWKIKDEMLSQTLHLMPEPISDLNLSSAAACCHTAVCVHTYIRLSYLHDN